MVAGESGLGKTLLLDVCRDDLVLRHTVVVMRDPQEVRTDTRLLKAIITQAGAKPSGRSGIAMMGDLHELTLALLRRERPLRILIDDAEQLSGSQLELIRTMLSNVSPASGAIGIILFGKPALVDKIDRRQGLVMPGRNASYAESVLPQGHRRHGPAPGQGIERCAPGSVSLLPKMP